MKHINTAGKITMKVLEVFHWVAVALMAAATVCALVAPQFVGWFVGIDGKECCGAELNVYGFEVNAPVREGVVDMTTLFLFGIGAVIILALMALVFRKLNVIFRNGEQGMPFHGENIRAMKWVGIFCMAVPLVGFVMSSILRLVLGSEVAEIGISQGGLFMGLVVLCLTQFFVHGARLEQDVDGLV